MDAMQNHFVISGHTLDDYYRMFDLSSFDLQNSIVNFGCAFDSFNMQMYAQQKNVTSYDTLYQMQYRELQEYIGKSLNKLEDYFSTSDEVVDTIEEDFIAKKRRSAESFLLDYPLGLQQKRYQNLSFSADAPLQGKFSLALSSHYFFVRSDLNFDFHVRTICEACRIADELRIFPLNSREVVSPLLGPVLLELQKRNYALEIRQVDYEVQKGSNAMLRIWNKGLIY